LLEVESFQDGSKKRVDWKVAACLTDEARDAKHRAWL
jgi:hypothetical protein